MPLLIKAKARLSEEEEEEEFERQWMKREEKLRGIVALMGPPTTFKTHIAERIGRWAKCPVLCIQDFFSPTASDDIKKNVTSDEEVVQRAFTALCKVAQRHLSYHVVSIINSMVVIKSRLNSTFELNELLELVDRTHSRSCKKYPLLIIECCVRNEYMWKQRIEGIPSSSTSSDSWYRPRSWKEMEKARDGYYCPQSQADWDLHLQQLLAKDSTTIVRRLVVDPHDDFISATFQGLPIDYKDAIKYLLTAPQGELVNTSQNPYNYKVELRELRSYLLEKRWSVAESKGRRKYLCPHGDCIFKYWEALIQHDQDHNICRVCTKQVEPGMSAYTCRLCILTLHKSCAERIDFKALRFNLELLAHVHYYRLLREKHACDRCLLIRKGFSIGCESCILNTHFRCGLIPTIIYHNSHPAHFLSLVLTQKTHVCKACGKIFLHYYFYCCKKCGLYYHIKCALLPLELLKHKHGEHEHVMKLMYSHCDDGMEPEEDYWCEVCYQDMDPQVWFYSCKDCPYYLAHLHCARGFEYLGNVKNAKFIPQIQSQLEDAMAETNVDSEIREKD